MSFRPADDFTSDELGLNSSVFTNVGQTADIKDDSEDTLVEAQEEPIEIPRGSDDNSRCRKHLAKGSNSLMR